MNGHSYIGASSAARWLACPGSVRLYKQLTQRRATIYAATGTVAHELCEKCLLDKTLRPASFLGQTFQQDGFSVTVDDAMVASVSVYVNRILSDHAKYGGELVVEQPFDLSWVYPGMYGRNDASIVPDRLFDVLRTYDYKNGRTNVDAQDNPQLMYYASGALGEHNYKFIERVIIHIIQPNASDGGDDVDEWEVSTSDLYAWVNDVLRPGAAKTEEPDAPFAEGDHCTFCEAAAFCPLKQSRVMALFDKPADVPVTELVLPAAQTITPERLGLLSAFFNGPVFEAWRKSLAAEEQAMLSRGVHIPGRHLVEKITRGNRKWVDEAEVVKAFGKILGDEVFDRKLKGPPAVENLLKAQGWDKKQRDELISGLVTRDETLKVSVVSDTDMAGAIEERRKKAVELFND